MIKPYIVISIRLHKCCERKTGMIMDQQILIQFCGGVILLLRLLKNGTCTTIFIRGYALLSFMPC